MSDGIRYYCCLCGARLNYADPRCIECQALIDQTRAT
jgi:hypothetical protein